MANYQNSKIYKIEPIIDHDEGDIYIGSTTKQYLSQRMDRHRANYGTWKQNKKGYTSSFKLFDKYGLGNCKIFLIELYPCTTKEELRVREGHLIKTIPCINKFIPGRTNKEYKEDNKDKM